MESKYLMAILCVALLTLVAIGYTGIKLAHSHSGDVRIVWYFFSLSLVCTCVAANWASSIGAIDIHGVFKGQIGSAINSILSFVLDLNTDIKLLLAILTVVVVPQIINYLLSGLFGCAAAPIFVGRMVTFFIWSIVKSFVTAAGVLSALAFYGYFNGWLAWRPKGAESLTLLSLELLILAFGILFFYREASAPIKERPVSEKSQILRKLVDLRSWLTRNVSFPNM